MPSKEKWFDQATTWLLCRPRFLGIRAVIFLAYALAVVLFADHWLVLTLGFFAAYNLGHGIFCLWHDLRGAASTSALLSVNAMAIALTAAGALAILAATNLPARRHRRPTVRYRLVTQA